MNNLTIEAYTTGTTRLVDPNDDLSRASGIRFTTNYPGGLFGDASFYIPRDVVRFLSIQGTHRVVIRNGLTPVYEGYVTSLENNLQEAEQGVTVNCIGAWGYIAMRRHWRRLWADNRITDNVWKYLTVANAAELCTVDRQSRLRFTPKAEAWTSDYSAVLEYTSPPGQAVERITYNYGLQEGGQAWEIRAARSADGTTWTAISTAGGDSFVSGTTSIITASGTGSRDITLAGAPIYVRLYYYARASQTPTSDGTYYGEFSNIMVYGKGDNEPPSGRGTASPLTAEEVCELIIGVDIGGGVTTGFYDEINSDTQYLGTVGLNLEPFIHERWTPIADIMTEAVSFGDASYDSWAVGMKASEAASSWDGKPVLYLEQYPALTDYDYAIRLDDTNVIPPFTITKDYGEIYNIVIVEYQDENGDTQQITPWDSGYSGLEDATSEAAYGDRAFVLNVGQSTAAAAYTSGQRFLAANKDPKWIVNGPIAVIGHIRSKDGNQIPACEIQAGKRIKIENYMEGLTFLISHTEYDDDSQTCTISIGPPQDLIYPRFVFQRPPPVNEAGTATASGESGSTESLNWKRREGLVEGTPEWDEAVRLGKKAWYEKYRKKKRG